jgi:hypothetical protein
MPCALPRAASWACCCQRQPAGGRHACWQLACGAPPRRAVRRAADQARGTAVRDCPPTHTPKRLSLEKSPPTPHQRRPAAARRAHGRLQAHVTVELRARRRAVQRHAARHQAALLAQGQAAQRRLPGCERRGGGEARCEGRVSRSPRGWSWDGPPAVMGRDARPAAWYARVRPKRAESAGS